MNSLVREGREWDSILRIELPDSAMQFLEMLSKKIEREIKRVKAIDIAEIGCGRGELVHSLARRLPRCYFVGYEQSNYAISKLKDEASPNEKFGRLELPRVPNRTFDCILCINTLHYVEDSLLSIERLWAITRPGGMMIFNYPNRYYVASLPEKPMDEYWGAVERPMRSGQNLLSQNKIRKALPRGKISCIHRSGPHNIYIVAEKQTERI